MDNGAVTSIIKGIKDWIAILALVAAVGMYVQIVKDQQRRITSIETYVANRHDTWLATREEIVRLQASLLFIQEQLRELRDTIKQDTPQ